MKKFVLPAIMTVVIITDRLSKVWALSVLAGKSKIVFGWLRFSYVENSGVAFGMFGGNNLFFLAFTALLVAVMLYWRRALTAGGNAAKIGFAMILAGALSNICDRIAYGFVVDFIDLSFFPAVFNPADAAITVGACIMILGMKNDNPALSEKAGKTEKHG